MSVLYVSRGIQLFHMIHDATVAAANKGFSATCPISVAPHELLRREYVEDPAGGVVELTIEAMR